MRLISRGRRAKILLLAGVFQFIACPPPENQRPLDYRQLFSFQSDFLSDITSLAVKGKAEFSNSSENYSGDFTIYLCGKDSVYFLIEGTLNMDLFSLAGVNSFTYYRDRESGYWTRLDKGDKLFIEDLQIDDLTAVDLAVLIFPQYYLDLDTVQSDNFLLNPTDGHRYAAVQGAENLSFTLNRNNSNILASYKKAVGFRDGFYPSEIEIFEKRGSWSVSFEISKIGLNPLISPKLWPVIL